MTVLFYGYFPVLWCIDSDLGADMVYTNEYFAGEMTPLFGRVRKVELGRKAG